MAAVNPIAEINTYCLTRCDPSTRTLDTSTTSTTDNDPTSQVVLQLSRRNIALVWLGILTLRSVCAMYLLSFGRVYNLLTGIDMEYYAQLLIPEPSFFKFPSHIFTVLGCAHCYRIIRMIGYSILSKAFVFERDHRWRTKGTRSNKRLGSSKTYRIKPLIQLYARLFGRQSCFGVESPYFELRFLIQECMEMVSQSAQVYSSSILIGKKWINHVYMIIIFVNSWSTPLVQHFSRHSPVLERIMCFAVDILLDFMASIVLPLVLIMPYYMKFNATMYNFDYSFLYDDVWNVNMIMESRQVFARGWFDLITKSLPHVSIYCSLGNIECLVRSMTVEMKQVMPCPTVVNTHSRRSLLLKTQSTRLAQRVRRMQRYQLRDCHAIAVHLGFLLWGLGLLFVHFWAVYGKYESMGGIHTIAGSCKQQQHPWFTTKTACSVYEYNCYRQGTTTVTEDSLAFLDEKSVAILTFAHCPQLVMPKSIQSFMHLICLDFWNSTIARWDLDAAITQRTHPSINFLGFIFTNMTSLPDGILSDDLPQTLKDIEIVHSNFTEYFPADLDKKWHRVNTLYVEHCGLTAVPESLLRMKIDDFSLVGNNLPVFPSIGAGGYYSLALSHNPLIDLGEEDTTNPSYPVFLAVENTYLDGFLEWVYAMSATDRAVYAYGTPFCENQAARKMITTYSGPKSLTCVNMNPRVDGKYPLEAMKLRRVL